MLSFLLLQEAVVLAEEIQEAGLREPGAAAVLLKAEITQ
jgi:hypothetical protein